MRFPLSEWTKQRSYCLGHLYGMGTFHGKDKGYCYPWDSELRNEVLRVGIAMMRSRCVLLYRDFIFFSE